MAAKTRFVTLHNNTHSMKMALQYFIFTKRCLTIGNYQKEQKKSLRVLTEDAEN